MSTQKLVNKNVRKLMKMAGSVVVSLPVEYLADLKWKHGQKVVVNKHGRHLIIKDWKA